MGNFVRDHAREFGFILRGEQEAGVDANVAAWHGKRVDRGIVDHEKNEFPLVAGTDRDQLVAKLVEVGFDFRVVQIARVGVDITHDGAPQCLLILVGKILARHFTQVGQVGGDDRLDG
jgi:hypothetical protein